MVHYELGEFERVGSPLGGGSFGHVMKVVHKGTGQVFAMKDIPKKKIVEHQMKDYLAREVKTQMRLKHPYIIALYYYFEDSENVHLLLEYAKGGSLFGLLRKRGRLPEPEAARYFSQVAQALDFLHQKGVIHRDLKPENILMCDDHVAKLADFGWCAEVDKAGEGRHTFCGTWDYLPPEMVNNEPHDHTVDVWAMGVLLYEMLTAKAPFAAASQMKTLMRITGVDLQPPDYVDVEAKELMQLLLVKEKAARLPLASACQHPWVCEHVPPEPKEENMLEKAVEADKSIFEPAIEKTVEVDKRTIKADCAATLRLRRLKNEKADLNAAVPLLKVDSQTPTASVGVTKSVASEVDEEEEEEFGCVMTRMTTEQFRQARHAAIQAEAVGLRCSCGNAFMPDERFCRKCGAARVEAPVVGACAGIGSGIALLKNALQTPNNDKTSQLPTATAHFFDALHSSITSVGSAELRHCKDSHSMASTAGCSVGAQSEPMQAPPTAQRSRRRCHTEGSARLGFASNSQRARLQSDELEDGPEQPPQNNRAFKVLRERLANRQKQLEEERQERETKSLAVFTSEELPLSLPSEPQLGGSPAGHSPGVSPAGTRSAEVSKFKNFRKWMKEKSELPPSGARHQSGEEMSPTSASKSLECDILDETRPSGRAASFESVSGAEGRQLGALVRDSSTQASARRGEAHEDLPASAMKRSNSETPIVEAISLQRTMSGRPSVSPSRTYASEMVQGRLSWDQGGIM